MPLLVRGGASAVSGKGRGEGKFVGQGKLWTQHPSGPGSPRAARDCALVRLSVMKKLGKRAKKKRNFELEDTVLVGSPP